MRKLFEFILVLASIVFIIAYSTTVFAKDVCFIGDSFTEGLRMYSGIDADYYDYRGISTTGILKKDVIKKNLANKNYKQIYILLGINEVCNNDEVSFSTNYQEIIRQIKELQPQATIVAQSIVHTTQKKSTSSSFKNEYINKYNSVLKTLCINYNINYIDINEIFDNGNGALFSDYSKDGIHLKQNQYTKWTNLLMETMNEK